MIDLKDLKMKLIKMLEDDINIAESFDDIRNYINYLYEVFEKYDDNTIIKVIDK